MMTDSQIMIKGMDALINSIGIVESEKFVSLILRESGDYTEWRKDLFKGKTLKEINAEAKKWWGINK